VKNRKLIEINTFLHIAQLTNRKSCTYISWKKATVLHSKMAHDLFRRIFKYLGISGRNISCSD